MDQQEERIRQLEKVMVEFVIAVAKDESTKIHAIRAYRMAMGATLKDAKEFVEGFAKPRAQIQDDARMQRIEDRVFHLERRVAHLCPDKSNDI